MRSLLSVFTHAPWRQVALILLTFSLIGCASTQDADETANWNEDKFSEATQKALTDGRYDTAINLLEKMEARFPYGSYAQQALLDRAYAHYKFDERDMAVFHAERFIRLYPQHPRLDYAYYLKGLAYFNESMGLFGKWVEQNPGERDPKSMRESLTAFGQLAERFPASVYRDDALKRMRYLNNTLASGEISVARYYYNRQAYLASLNRSKFVIENYPDAPGLDKALAIMIKSYAHLGMTDLYEDALRVYQKNFNNSDALKELEGKKRS